MWVTLRLLEHLRARWVESFKHLQDGKVCVEVRLSTGEKVLLPTAVTLDVSRLIRLLHKQAEQAECCAAARHYLWQIRLHVVLNLTV